MTLDAGVAFERDYEALGASWGVLPLIDWSSVTIGGADRQLFLHNFCTNDVKRLAPGQSCEAFFTNVKGKTIGHGLITCRDDELVIVGAPGQGTSLAAHLERYVIREDVAVRDSTAERFFVWISGGDGLRVERLVRETSEQSALSGCAYAAWFEWKLLGCAVGGVLELTQPVADSLSLLAERGAMVCGQAGFHARRIEAGTPLFGVDFDERHLPQEVGRNDEAISFTKGCYLGQETVARIDALGHVNHEIAGVRFLDGELPAAGLELTCEGKSAGTVTSVTFSPRLQSPLGLAMLRREHKSVGRRLGSAAGACEVVALPLL
jgi:tRNA-modifying protein YgfZ